ncbi:MAG: carbonic anhydrase, partial [Armatimonadota bacterium]|nr:carbonic anhydrase [Armatimonadota bacterium]
HVLVVGHTDCGMARSDPGSIAERLKRRGVSDLDVRGVPAGEWLGLFRDEAENVRHTVAKLRKAPMLPKDVGVEGALFDVVSGELTWLDA